MKSMVIGFVQGLAGSAAIIVLTFSTVGRIFEGDIYMLIFGGGTIIRNVFIYNDHWHSIYYEFE